MRGRRKNKKKQIEISSLIDILFILLIFLMLSVRFTESRTLQDFNLPKSDANLVGDSTNEVSISISKESSYFLNGSPIQKSNLIRFIKTELDVAKNPTIILELDVDSKFGDFYEITEIFKTKSISKIQISTLKK